jgi:hypothetical protein
MDFLTWFDFGPNGLGNNHSLTMPFPIEDFATSRQVLVQHPPSNILQQLVRLGWPPSPAFYPSLIPKIITTAVSNVAVTQDIFAVFDRKYWEGRIALWREYKLLFEREDYVAKAISEYLEGDYISTIYVIVPQFEGIVNDYLTQQNENTGDFRSKLQRFKKLLNSRKLLMFPKIVIDNVTDYLETGTFWTNTARIGDSSQNVNRHGIAHGVFKKFENQELALKHLILMDSLAFLIMHDRLVTSSL